MIKRLSESVNREKLTLFIAVLFLISIFIFSSVNMSHGQSNNIIKYDYYIYKGLPIKSGWLFADDTYKNFYSKIIYSDSLIGLYMIKDSLNIVEIIKFGKLKEKYEKRISEKDSFNMFLQEKYFETNDLLTNSLTNHKETLMALDKCNNRSIRIKDIFFIGIPCLGAGILIGIFADH